MTNRSKKSTSKKPTTKKTTTKKTSKTSSKKVAAATKDTNNREHCRVPVQLLVDYRSDGNYLFDFCRDLGVGGVFIQTKEPLPMGSDVALTFTLPDSKETLDAKGKVIWVQGFVPERKDLAPGMGVQFEQFAPEQRELLENFISRYGNLHADSSKSAS